MNARKPAVAGTFYPADPGMLRAEVQRYIGDGDPEGRAAQAIVAPHAGYVYSGPVAGSAYARVAARRGSVERVVLLGPAHFWPVDGLAASSADAFLTPLGAVRVDREAAETALRLPQVDVVDAAHAGEHSLEVQLPFLQVALGDVAIVPLVVGAARTDEVAEVLTLLWEDARTLVVVSSDLSHYHPYEEARLLDEGTARTIEALRPDALDDERACGAAAIRGLLTAAAARSLRAETLDLRNSGDTAGPRNRVVGYGAWAFTAASA